MDLSEFLEELFAEGRVAVPAPAELTEDEMSAAAQVVEGQERLLRLDLPNHVPRYEQASAVWAAAQFYRACQLAMFRDVGEDAISKLAGTKLENWDVAEVHYSVDLTFRYLPDLVRIAKSIASEDPLVDLLMQWCRRWPLSSVGVGATGDVPLGPIVESPGLMQMYVDRIFAREDTERLKCEPVRARVRQALGLYPALAPKFTSAATCMVGKNNE